MLCKKPFMQGLTAHGCGQCLPCRINRRRQWMWRQVLEGMCHEENAFVTLTYSDENLPEGLVKEDVRNWLKRFRKAIAPLRVRYFAVGEYGEHGTRLLNPHYHLSLFGVSGHTDLSPRGVPTHYGISEVVWRTWGRGIATCHEFNDLTAQYVAGYTVKKMTTVGDPRLHGLPPEFARMSLRPALGTDAMLQLATVLQKTPQEWRGVPMEVHIGKKSIPLGRTMLKKLYNFMELHPDVIREMRDEASWEKSAELFSLWSSYDAVEAITPKKVHLEMNAQRVLQLEARSAIWSKRGRL